MRTPENVLQYYTLPIGSLAGQTRKTRTLDPKRRLAPSPTHLWQIFTKSQHHEPMRGSRLQANKRLSIRGCEMRVCGYIRAANHRFPSSFGARLVVLRMETVANCHCWPTISLLIEEELNRIS